MGENSQDNTQNGAPVGGLQKKTKIAYGVGAVGKDMVYMLVASYELNQMGIKIDMYRQEYRFTPAFAFIQAV